MNYITVLTIWGIFWGIIGLTIASAKNRSKGWGFFVGVLTGPVGIIVLACLKKKTPLERTLNDLSEDKSNSDHSKEDPKEIAEVPLLEVAKWRPFFVLGLLIWSIFWSASGGYIAYAVLSTGQDKEALWFALFLIIVGIGSFVSIFTKKTKKTVYKCSRCKHIYTYKRSTPFNCDNCEVELSYLKKQG